MALTLDYLNLIVHSDASITDGIAFHGDLRDIEASMFGILYPVIHTFKLVPVGGGAYFPALAFINGWTLQFPAGTFAVTGFNLNATINPVNNCYVERFSSAAYAVTAVGGTGLSPSDIAAVASEVRTELTPELAKVDTIETNSVFADKIIKNKKEITKIGTVKSINVFDDDGTTPILTKALKDDSGNDISDLSAGVMAKELASSV